MINNPRIPAAIIDYHAAFAALMALPESVPVATAFEATRKALDRVRHLRSMSHHDSAIKIALAVAIIDRSVTACGADDGVKLLEAALNEIKIKQFNELLRAGVTEWN